MAMKKSDAQSKKKVSAKKVYKQMKSSEKADDRVHKDIAKMLKKEEREGGRKGDEKLHEMAEKRDKNKKSLPKEKIKIVMSEFKAGKLKSGSKKGPQVKKPKVAIAIALSEARKASKKTKK